jgi:hypothetical protein
MKIIISNSDVGAIIKASKNILEKYNTNGEIPENIKGQACLSVIKKLIQNSKHFSVCSIVELAKMNEVFISSEHMEFFNAMHCVNWEDMNIETREYIMALVVDYFKSNIAMANVQ